MALIAIGLVVVLVVAGSLLAWRRARAPASRGDAPTSAAAGDAAASRRAPRHDTALDELRAMRDALKPAEHSRVERRRPGSGVARAVPERRRGRGSRPSLAGERGAPGAAPPAGESEPQDRV